MSDKTKLNIKRFILMLMGNVFIGMGVAFIKMSRLGNDPCSSLTIAFNAAIHQKLSIGLIIFNCFYFLIELIWGRKYIGLGTFFNWTCVGFVCDWFTELLNITPVTFGLKFVLMLAGGLVISLGAALYQTSNEGIAPYDSIAIILSEHLPIHYFWCRMITDSLCALGAFFLGGPLGIGTLVCAFGLGPCIVFFTRYVARPLLGIKKEQKKII